MILRVTILVSLWTAVSVNAAVLMYDTFEGSLGNWTAEANAYLYSYNGSGINYATEGRGALAIQTTYDEGILTLSNNLRLKSAQATSVTINLDYEWDMTNATRYICIDYSTDGGKTWTNKIGDRNSWGSFTGIRTLGSYSKTLEEKTIGAFTDEFKFRIRGKDDKNPVTAFIDNIEIIGADVVSIRETKDDIPEPSILAFICCVASIGGLRWQRRR